MRTAWFSANGLVLRLNREHIATALRAHGRGRALDIGCGAGPYKDLVQQAGAAYLGVEPDRRRYAATPPAVWGDGLHLPFRRHSFATALCSQVLEHVPEPGELLAEISRVLQPGGYLILSAPHIWGVHEAPHDYFRFTQYGLEHLARKAGLEPVDVQPMAGYWVTAGARFCYYLRQFEKLGLAFLVRPLYALVQLLSWGLDRLHRVESDTWNWLLVARKPSATGRCP